MRFLRSRHSSSQRARWPLWAFALALLLKAAVPMLAVASAHAQGKTVVEVCTVYGVATRVLETAGPAVNGSAGGEHEAPGLSHGSDHCVLSGLLAWAAPPSVSTTLTVAAKASAGVDALRIGAPPIDVVGRWTARLKHGPPAAA